MFGYFFIFRSVATAILMVVVFFALFSFLLTDNLRDNFLSSKFYNANLAENDVYNRFYDEVLVDPEFNDTTDELLGNVDIPQEDIAGVAREIMPADYLRDQVEGAVIGTIDYLNKETDTPEVFIELALPLANVKPVLFSYMDRRIDELEEVPVSTLEELETGLEDIYRTLERGEIPTQVPSLTSASVGEFVDDAYDNAFESIKDAGLSEKALRGLEQQDDVIKGLLREGNVKESLKVGSREIVGPLVYEALDELRGEFDDRERLDLTAIAADQSQQDKEQFLEELDAFREVIHRGEAVVWISIVVLVLGILLIMV
ncbi:MAG: hypothetical protein J4F46_09335, partial [Dehalococcoidia bacterium]|nr:hypothetical protein [Dehalococcoidia bacterium]